MQIPQRNWGKARGNGHPSANFMRTVGSVYFIEKPLPTLFGTKAIPRAPFGGFAENLFVAREVDKIEEREEKREVMELITEWEREGRKEGRHEAGLLILQQLLTRHFGPLPRPLLSQIKELSFNQIEALITAQLDFNSISDVQRWLARRKR